jgi:hypothetical protein
MPIMTRGKRGKRAREASEEFEDPDIQLGWDAGNTDLVRCWLNTLLPYTKKSVVILICHDNIDKPDAKH